MPRLLQFRGGKRDLSMDDNNLRIAMAMTRIPLIVYIVLLAVFLTTAFINFPVNMEPFFALLVEFGLITLFLAPFPGAVISVVGLVHAKRAREDGYPEAGRLMALSIVELVIAIALMIGALIMYNSLMTRT